MIVTAGDLWAALVDVPPDTPVMLLWNPHLEINVPRGVRWPSSDSPVRQ